MPAYRRQLRSGSRACVRAVRVAGTGRGQGYGVRRFLTVLSSEKATKVLSALRTSAHSAHIVVLMRFGAGRWTVAPP